MAIFNPYTRKYRNTQTVGNAATVTITSGEDVFIPFLSLSFLYHFSFLYSSYTMNSKAVAMDIYRQTRHRTAVIDLIKEGSLYKRCDVIQTVVDCVGRNKISSVGQLENNLSWEVVFTDVAAKDVFVRGNHKVKGHDAVHGAQSATKCTTSAYSACS